MSEIAVALESLAKTLAPYDRKSANYVRRCKERSAQEIADDLNLWGGCGSLMDQGIYGKGREIQRPFEAAAAALSMTLRTAGASSSRMESWEKVFLDWQSNKI